MKKAAKITLILLALVVVFAGCKPKLNWEEFESDEGEFSILMPGEPVLSKDVITTEIGDIDIYMYSVEAGNTAYLVSYNDLFFLREIELTRADIKQILDDGRDGAVKSFDNGKLNYEKKVSIDGYPGKEFQVEGSKEGLKAVFTARAFLVNERLYQIAVTSVAGKVSEEDIEKFLDSFELK